MLASVRSRVKTRHLITLLLLSTALLIQNVQSVPLSSQSLLKAPKSTNPPDSMAEGATVASTSTFNQSIPAAWPSWRAQIASIPAPHAGCFAAAYPSTVWQKTTCAPPTSGHETPSHTLTTPSTVGNGNDFVAQSSSALIGSAVGTFPSVTGLTSETDVCVGPPPFCTSGGEGSNAYSLQINAIEGFPVTFNGWSGTGWQQFVFDNEPSGFHGVWIEYWLFNYLATHASCPGSVPQNPSDGGPWFSSGSDCVWNTDATGSTTPYEPYEPATSLSLLSFEASANLNLNSFDEGQLCVTGGSCYLKSEPATVLNLYQQWRLAEFNVFGFIDGSQAQFNSGTAITMNNALKDQSGNTITPVAPCPNNGQTGETNNLNLGSCTVNGNAVVFSESNAPPTVTFNTNPTSFLGASSPGSISACSGTFTNGESSTGCGSGFSATANLPSPSTGWQFSNWVWAGGVSCKSPQGGSANPTSCEVSSSGSLEAVFVAQITFNTSPTSAGSISWASCSNPGYTNGQTLLSSNFGANTICANTLTNAPFAGWSCTGSISCSGLNPVSTATLDGPGTITANFGFPPISFDFRLSNSGGSSNLEGITVAPGGSGSITVTATLVNGPAQTVTLTCSQANGSPLPSGVSCSPGSGTPPFTTTLTVTVSSSTTPGYYTIQVIGTAGTLSRSTLFTLYVT